MGMFDTIEVHAPLPGWDSVPEAARGHLQTKDLECVLTHYVVDATFALFESHTEYEPTPEEEHPYYGTEDWDRRPIVRMLGILRPKSHELRRVYHNGTVRAGLTWRDGDSFKVADWDLVFVHGVMVAIEGPYDEAPRRLPEETLGTEPLTPKASD